MHSSSTFQVELAKSAAEEKEQSIKVVVWDLDNTIWDGVLLEDETVALRAGVLSCIQELDRRGILQSISSKNDEATAMRKLESLGIAKYFLYPQIHWDAKSEAVKTIAARINVGIDTLAFIDDQAFEREEVAFSVPQVLCVDATQVPAFLDRKEFKPRFLTEDSSRRRLMYMSDIQRDCVEQKFVGTKDEFLATLGLELTIAVATEEDLQRAEELTRRTHQLNTTGYTYSYDELRGFMFSTDHDLLIASLEDKYGTYGKIGLCLIEKAAEYWTVKLLLMSCRVMSRGVGTILMNHVIAQARRAGVRLRAEFVRTDRNRLMYVTYRFGNFRVISQTGDLTVFENDCSTVASVPGYAKVNIVGKCAAQRADGPADFRETTQRAEADADAYAGG